MVGVLNVPESTVIYNKTGYVISGGRVDFVLPEYDASTISLNNEILYVYITPENVKSYYAGQIIFSQKGEEEYVFFGPGTYTINSIKFGPSGNQKIYLSENGYYEINEIIGTGRIIVDGNAELVVTNAADTVTFYVGFNSRNEKKSNSIIRTAAGAKSGINVHLYGRFCFAYVNSSTVTVESSGIYNTVLGNDNTIVANAGSYYSTFLGNNLRITDNGIGNKSGTEPVKDGAAASGIFGNITIDQSTIRASNNAISIPAQCTIGVGTASTSINSGDIIVSGGIGIGNNCYISGSLFVAGNRTSGVNTGDQTITLTGEVSGSGTSSFATTISNSAVIGKLLTGFVSGAGIITSADSILSAVQKLNGNAGLFISGSGLSGQIPYFNGTRTLTGNAAFVYSATQGLTITNNTASTSTTSGALIVTGGAGFGGAINSTSITTGSGTFSGNITLTGNQTVGGTFGVTGASSFGNAAFSGITASTIAASGIVQITNTTSSTSVSTGALVVTAGGLGVFGAVNSASLGTGAGTFSGIVTVSNNTASTSASNGALVVTGGVGIGGSINVTGNITGNTISVANLSVTNSFSLSNNITVGGATINGICSIYGSLRGNANTGSNLTIQANSADSNTGSVIIATSTASTNTSSGALQVNGGVGIKGAIYGTSSTFTSLAISNDATISGTTTLNNLTVSGNSSFNNLSISGSLNLSGLSVSGATNVSGLTVSGVSNFNNNITISGTVNLNNNFTITGTSAFNNNITVSGTSTFSNTVTSSGAVSFTNNFSVSGSTALASTTISGDLVISTNGTSLARFINTNSGTNNTDGLEIGYNTNAYINNRENTTLTFATNNTTRMTIEAAGNVSIAVQPTADTHVPTKLYVDTLFTRTIKYKSTDESRINTTTLTNDSALNGLALVTGAYSFYILLFVVTANANPDINIQIATTSNNSNAKIWFTQLGSATVNAIGTALPYTIPVTALTANVNNVFVFEGTMTTTSAGVLNVLWAQRAADNGNSVSVLSGSFMRAERIV